MWCKLISVAVLHFTLVDGLEEAYQDDFSIVSTTQQPSEHQQLKDVLTNLEYKWEFQSKLEENNQRLEALEVQTNQTLDLLESTNSALANISSQHTKPLEIFQLQNEQILRKLENMSLELESLKNQHTRLETNEFQNQKDLKHMNFTLTRYTNRQFSTILPKNCKELKEKGKSISQVYSIEPELSSGPFPVLCDMETKEGGWIYVLNRFDGSQDFFLNWTDYKKGFGNLSGEFWIGLDHLYQLTGQEPKELLVELVDWNQTKAFAHYDKFSIGNEEEGYFLKSVGNYTGNAGDSLSFHFGMKFSTKDRDQDLDVARHCATYWRGAWWFGKSLRSHLTAKYIGDDPVNYGEGLQWYSFDKDFEYTMKKAKMMIR